MRRLFINSLAAFIFGQTQRKQNKRYRPKIIITAAYFLCHFLQRKYWQALSIMGIIWAAAVYIFSGETKKEKQKKNAAKNKNRNYSAAYLFFSLKNPPLSFIFGQTKSKRAKTISAENKINGANQNQKRRLMVQAIIILAHLFLAQSWRRRNEK